MDAKLDVVESCDRNGGNRIQLSKLYAPHPFAISVFDDFVYWTDWMTMAIHRAHRLTGLQHSVLLNSSHRLMGLQVSAFIDRSSTAADIPLFSSLQRDATRDSTCRIAYC